jgi:hypothetical protein
LVLERHSEHRSAERLLVTAAKLDSGIAQN